MSGSFGQPMSVCIARRNPVRVPRRDILVVASDTPVICLTVYQQDTDTAPLDVSNAAIALNIYRERDLRRTSSWWDYGFCRAGMPPVIIASFPGLPIDPINGRVDIAFSGPQVQQAAPPSTILPPPTNYGAGWVAGRFWYELAVSYQQAEKAGIGVVRPNGAQNYAQGNHTILEGVIDFPLGAAIPLTQAPELLGGIGLAS